MAARRKERAVRDMRSDDPGAEAGSFEQFRQEWEPRPWPPGLVRAVISRNDQDPNQVLTASFLDISLEQLDALRDDPAVLGAEESRLARIAPYQEAFLFKGLFEVVEDLAAPPPG
jgi:hypothetical protein